MVNYKLENFVWVNLLKLSDEELDKILRNIEIDRAGTGGVMNANKGVKDIIGDSSFWDKFVFHNNKWRLGSIVEEVLPYKEIRFESMFAPTINIKNV
jgi:hypothetical protein